MLALTEPLLKKVERGTSPLTLLRRRSAVPGRFLGCKLPNQPCRFRDFAVPFPIRSLQHRAVRNVPEFFEQKIKNIFFLVNS